ncbi:unnamed protein product [Rhodiola kirilowii]
MKIRCDFCDQEDAVMFCSADEAALCNTCDERVHRVNKVAQRHDRFSLVVLSPSSAASALCDVCQERRALLFCQQDRAILCRECDYPIHMANEQTKKHCRFLLTGVKLTPLSSSDQISCDQEREQSGTKRRRQTDGETASLASSVSSVSASGSSISEYLETLPGWHIEEFFDHLQDPNESYFYHIA